MNFLRPKAPIPRKNEYYKLNKYIPFHFFIFKYISPIYRVLGQPTDAKMEKKTNNISGQYPATPLPWLDSVSMVR